MVLRERKKQTSFSEEEHKLISESSGVLGLSFSSFIRSAALTKAKKIKAEDKTEM